MTSLKTSTRPCFFDVFGGCTDLRDCAGDSGHDGGPLGPRWASLNVYASNVACLVRRCMFGGKSSLDYFAWVLIYYPLTGSDCSFCEKLRIIPAALMLVGMLLLLSGLSKSVFCSRADRKASRRMPGTVRRSCGTPISEAFLPFLKGGLC